MAQTHSFASIGPSLSNALSPSVRSTILSGSLFFLYFSQNLLILLMGALCTAALLKSSPRRGTVQMHRYNTINDFI